jgi:hypothetical protein
LDVNFLNYTFHYDLGFGYDVEQDESSKKLWGSTFVKCKKANIVPKQRQASVHAIPFKIFRFIIVIML